MWFRAALATLLVVTEGADPIAPHILVVVQPGRDAVVRLTGYDTDGDKLRAAITSVPTWTLQVSHGNNAPAAQLTTGPRRPTDDGVLDLWCRSVASS